MSRQFRPMDSAAALLNFIYAGKFSRNVPLVVILLSAAYAVYRSMHYLSEVFHLAWWIALPTALFIELLVLASGALVYIQWREAYIAELRGEDEQEAKIGAWGSLTLLGFALAALLTIAAADAWIMTANETATALMVLIQIGQSGMILLFVNTALLETRRALRSEYADWRRGRCQYCGVEVTPNNRKKHEDSCPSNPKNGAMP